MDYEHLFLEDLFVCLQVSKVTWVPKPYELARLWNTFKLLLAAIDAICKQFRLR